MASILDLPKKVKRLPEYKRRLFRQIFTVTTNTGQLVVPETMVPWVQKTFGNLDKVQAQTIVRVHNNFTYEGAIFNELRSSRPIQEEKDANTEQTISDAKGGPFCNVETQTSADTFGKLRGKYSVAVSNVAKYDFLHGVIVFNEHHPRKFQEREVIDYFQTAKLWIETAYKEHPSAVYPFIVWNCLWRSGASIIHGHMQTMLTTTLHYAKQEFYNDVQGRYSREFGSNYFDDLVLAHKAVGLAKTKWGIPYFVNLAPRKEKEVVIVSDQFDEKLFRLVHHVLRRMIDKLGMESFNLAVYMPPLTEEGTIVQKGQQSVVPGWKGFKYVVRIVDRGSLKKKTSDVGAVELYTDTNVIASDPYKVIKNF